MFSHETRKILEENEPPKERSVYAKKVPVGFKTGTSYRFRDAWTAGFFGDYVLVVWYGNFDGSDGNFIGRENAAPIFFQHCGSGHRAKTNFGKSGGRKKEITRFLYWTQTEWDAKEKCRYFKVTLVTCKE